MTDYAFDTPVLLASSGKTQVRTAQEAASILRFRLREQFTIAGLNALLMLERAAHADEIEAARHAFCSWASSQQLLRSH